MKAKQVVKLLIGIIVIGGGISYFMFQAMQSSWSYYYSVDEFSSNREAMVNQSLRLAGLVKEGTVDRSIEKMRLTFALAGSETEIGVFYKGVVPDNFTEGKEVVVEGRLDGEGVFQADTLMTKCDSKYKSKVNDDD
jgi:cytochrome c-type biogenesis protein CcmE